jgi:hypothetical protein
MEEVILSKIEELRVASNAGEITSDEFLERFFVLREQLINL